MSKKKDVELDEFAQAQHQAFVAGLEQPESDAARARRAAGNTAFGGLETVGELEVIKAADVTRDSAKTKGKES